MLPALVGSGGLCGSWPPKTKLKLRLLRWPYLIIAHQVPREAIPINIINLDKDKVRWEKVTRDLLSKGVPSDRMYRFRAVHGKTLSTEELWSNTTTLSRWFSTPGMIGCYLSHREFWRKTLNGTAPWQIVLEDDAIVVENFYDKVEEAIEELQQCEETRDRWDVLLLGGLGCIHPQGKYGLNRVQALVAGKFRKPRQVTAHCHVPCRAFGTHGYVLSRRGAGRLLQWAGVATGHVDVVIWGIQELVLLCRHPMLVHQDMDSTSTVGGVTGGLEMLVPTCHVDDYTGTTLKWALNEPVLVIPGFGLVLTVGRALSSCFVGYVLAAVFWRQVPWLLFAHTALTVTVFFFIRIMNTPVGRLQEESLSTTTLSGNAATASGDQYQQV